MGLEYEMLKDRILNQKTLDITLKDKRQFTISIEDAKYWSGVANDIIVELWDKNACRDSFYTRVWHGIRSQNDSGDVRDKVIAVKAVYLNYIASLKLWGFTPAKRKDQSLLSNYRCSKRKQKQMINKCNRVLIMTPDLAMRRGLL